MRCLAILAVSVALMALAVRPPNVAAPDEGAVRSFMTQWTSQFDAGESRVYNDVAQGGETHTNNSVVPKDYPFGLMLPNVYGDNFRTNSTDGETDKIASPNYAACTPRETGTVTISQTDAGGVDAADGSLIFTHGTDDNSTRSVTGPIQGWGEFSVTTTLRYQENIVGENVTVALYTGGGIPPYRYNPWCGGLLVPGVNASGAGVYIVQSGAVLNKLAQAFVIDYAGTITLCGAAYQVGTAVNVTIKREGTYWWFRVGNVPQYKCPCSSLGPMYLTWDYVTTNQTGVLMVDSYATVLQDVIPYIPSTWPAVKGVFFGTSPANQNYTTRHTDENLEEWEDEIEDTMRPRLVSIYANRHPDYPAHIGAITLWKSDYTDFYVVDAGLDLIPVGSDNWGESRMTWEIPMGAVTFDGPFMLELALSGGYTGVAWIRLIDITFRGQPTIVPPPAPNTVPEFMDEIIGGGYFCGVVLVVGFTFLVGVRRLKGGG